MFTYKIEIRERLVNGTAGDLIHALPGEYESIDEARAQGLAGTLSDQYQGSSGVDATMGVVVPVT